MLPTKSSLSRYFSRTRLLIAAFAGFQAASGCGLVASDDTGSETHWLMRCDSDADCGASSCDCGVCTKSCSADADCSQLDVAGARCALPSACGTDNPLLDEAIGGSCFLLCETNADCATLGAAASCERGRCELASAGVEGGGSTSGTGEESTGQESMGGGDIDTLCDGSEDVRFVSLSGGGFVGEHYFFAQSYGSEFYAIDGQCRFWHGYNDGRVYSNVLNADQAQSFAQSLGFGRLSRFGFVEEYECDDAGFRLLWSAEGTISCSCQCEGSARSPAGFRAAFAADQMARSELFGSGEPLTGDAQLLLLESSSFPDDNAPLPWPLEREPTAQERGGGSGYANIAERSGALITDAQETAALRAARTAFKEREGYFMPYTAIVMPDAGSPSAMPDAGSQEPRYFEMLLRDEVPPQVKAALQRALDAL